VQHSLRLHPAPQRSEEARLEEAIGLARAIDLEVVQGLIVQVSQPRPATLMGTGKIGEIKALLDQHDAGLVIVDHPLTPVQQRNLEKEWNAKVIDRTGLILEIFGRRASTKEGTLQVDLAHLNYQKGRLVRSWTHLERQRGGAGFMGGPGETQIEADRRLLQERIVKLERELEQVVRTRQLHRAKRRKVPHPIVALVGYTNAGKSTLFNRMTGAGVLAEDMLFATLDPTLRRMKLPHGRTVILSDTVGFISDLPTHLVAAFRATLEEVLEADLILHVRDMSDPDNAAQSADVMRILSDLGIDEKEREARIIEVWNKIDRPRSRGPMMRWRNGQAAAITSWPCRRSRARASMRCWAEIARRLSGVLTENHGRDTGRQAGARLLGLRERDRRRAPRPGGRFGRARRAALRKPGGSARAPARQWPQAPRRKTGSGSPQRCRPRLRLHSETRYSWVGGAP
jgi:GTP-binding protein HflX